MGIARIENPVIEDADGADGDTTSGNRIDIGHKIRGSTESNDQTEYDTLCYDGMFSAKTFVVLPPR
jgi:hypothetical protein